jgi:flagellar hook-basal body complex protein FliE
MNPITPAAGAPISAPSTTATPAQGAPGATSNAFEAALDGVQNSLVDADIMSQQVATGQITDLSQLSAATAKAELGVQLTVAFRDRAIDSFQTIMRMQI